MTQQISGTDITVGLLFLKSHLTVHDVVADDNKSIPHACHLYDQYDSKDRFASSMLDVYQACPDPSEPCTCM